MASELQTAELSRAEWLAERKQGIGASECAAILGVDPFRSAFQVWAEKIGDCPPEDLSDNEAVEFGVRLERPIIEAYAARTGRRCDPWPQHVIVRSADRSWLTCTPDATQEDDGRDDVGTLQVKTASAYKAADWTDGTPLNYQCQCQHELAVTGHEWGTLVVLIGGQRLRYYDFVRNDRFIEAMIPKLEEFWQLVQTRTAPPVDASLATARVLARLHPNDTGDTVQLPDDALDWSRELDEAKEALDAAEEWKREAENKLKAAIGDATFGLLPDGSRWSWKSQTRKSYVAKESTYRVLKKLK